ncbi:chromate transporter [Yaniella flava]|uniref:chromate transporter n=1 Tax=Yaniella flava TaxID=287930 RepID=UPI0031D3255F
MHKEQHREVETVVEGVSGVSIGKGRYDQDGTGRIFRIFLKLRVTSLGGPVGHLGYFREELVSRRRSITEEHYGQLVALRQFLPGPASSQVDFALGLLRDGYLGRLRRCCWCCLPSVQ